MNPRRIRVILALFTLSGMCALVYQMVWTRWLGLILGNFASATATVVATFMAGLAIGNALAGRFVAGRKPREALRIYGFLEAALAALGALSPLVLSTSSPIYGVLAAAASGAVARALVCALLLLPPTVLMGLTLPSLVQALRAAAPRALGPLYALNTLGGAAGPLLAAFVLMPVMGMRLTAWLTALANAGVAAAAIWLSRAAEGDAVGAEPDGGGEPAEGPDAPEPAWPPWIPYAFGALSGCIALAFEIALTRLMVLTITGGSVYGFAIILSSFLLGLGLGAWLLRIVPPRNASSAIGAFAMMQGAAWLFAMATPFWDQLPPLLVRIWWEPIPFPILSVLNFSVILGGLLVLTTASGYALPALAAALRPANSASVGRLFAANTLGSLAGTVICGFMLMPWRGLTSSLLIIGDTALLTAAAAASLARPQWRIPILATAPFLAIIAFVMPRPDETIMNAGMYNRPASFRSDAPMGARTPEEAAHNLGRIIYMKDSVTARIVIRARSAMELTFIVNGKPDGSTSRVDMYTQIFMAQIPALSHPKPERALVIGMGTGTSAGSLSLFPSIREIHVVEIEPAQIDVARYFSVHNNNVLANTKVRVHLDDARHYVLADRTGYDLVVSEPSNLFVSGMVNLFTREFYESVRKRMNPGGVFMQWIHYYRVWPEDLRGMLATFRTVFPHVSLWIHEYGDAFLLAGNEPFSIDPREWKRRMSLPAIAADLARVQVNPPEKLLGYLLWGPADVERYSQGGRVVTDDMPYPEFTTPRMRYTPRATEVLRMQMQTFRPLQPIPLKGESARMRAEFGDLFLENGSMARAEAEYLRATELAPDDRDFALKLAYIRWDLFSGKTEALGGLRKYLARHPGDPAVVKRMRAIERAAPPAPPLPDQEAGGPQSPATSYP